MAGRKGCTLTESTHSDCYECLDMVRVAYRFADENGRTLRSSQTRNGHTGQVTAYDPE
jgi:hypothetical protein